MVSSFRPTQYAHYPGYSTHYPQAAYTAHYPYATASQSQSQPQPQPQPQPTTTTRQSAQQGGGTDSADIASLSDALGSAGVDLKASVFACSPRNAYRHLCHRLKRNHCNARMNLNRIGISRIVRANNRLSRPSTPALLARQCERSVHNTRLRRYQKIL
jgi:hypothetical protein